MRHGLPLLFFSFKPLHVWGNILSMKNRYKMRGIARNIKALKAGAIIIQFAIVLFFSAPTDAASDPAIKAGLIPHKALYDISLTSKKNGVMLSNLSGKMLYEWRSSCDGWVSNYQFDMLYEYVEMPAARVTSDVSTYEAFDGKNFTFNAQRKKDGPLFEQFRGATSLGEDGKNIVVNYSIPKDLVQPLPKGTFFPMGHTLDVLNKIKQGTRFYSVPLFDGSDGKGPVDINTFIGDTRTYRFPENSEESPVKMNIDPALVNTKAWDVRLAFFPHDSSDTMSDYEMSVVFHENGIISSIEIEYSDFSISQNLIAIEPVESGCDISTIHKKDEEIKGKDGD